MPDFSTIRFANIGRIHCNTKGLDILFEILSFEKWKKRNWVLNIYGEGDDKDYLIDLIHYYNLSNKINFLGYKEDIIDIWKDTHILILPSISEGTPAVIVEAMLCGRIGIVTDVGDNTNLVKDNFNGFVASAPTVKLFDEALERAWQNKNNWANYGLQAFESINKYVEDNPEKTLLTKMIKYL